MSPASCAIVLAFFVAAWGAETRSDPGVHLNGKASVLVSASIRGAARRLSWRDCQRVLDDFHDGSGHPLSTVLASRGQTAPEYLSTVVFTEGDSAGLCATDDSVVAFTSPGNRAVFVCVSRFEAAFDYSQTYAEVVIIHEMLHTLGLGERPPTSAQITGQVMRRCGAAG